MREQFDIRNVIDLRTEQWEDISEKEKTLIEGYINAVLDHSEKKGILFNKTAGSVFATHLTTLYKRIDEDFTMDIDDSMIDQLGEELLEVGKDIRLITNEWYGSMINDSELFLILTHLGSMKLIMEEEANEKN